MHDVTHDDNDTQYTEYDTSPESDSIRGSVRARTHDFPPNVVPSNLEKNGHFPAAAEEYDDMLAHGGYSNDLDAPLLSNKGGASQPLNFVCTPYAADGTSHVEASYSDVGDGSVMDDGDERRAPKFRLYARMAFQGHKCVLYYLILWNMVLNHSTVAVSCSCAHAICHRHWRRTSCRSFL